MANDPWTTYYEGPARTVSSNTVEWTTLGTTTNNIEYIGNDVHIYQGSYGRGQTDLSFQKIVGLLPDLTPEQKAAVYQMLRNQIRPPKFTSVEEADRWMEDHG